MYSTFEIRAWRGPLWGIALWAAMAGIGVKRGFAVVVPSRRGYGRSDGVYAEGIGRCDDPDYRSAGLQTARDIWLTIDFMSKQPFVDRRRVVLVGHSAGGFGSLALASLNPKGVVGVVNFAGGRGSLRSDFVCSPPRLRAAVAQFGRTSTIPTLWLYAKNDHFFGPSLARAMYGDYVASGGRAQLVELPDHDADGHQVFLDPVAISLWTDAVAQFLADLGFSRP